jgi:AraC family transcriptional regulator
MADENSGVWDGRRPLWVRNVVKRHETTLSKMGIVVATERLDKPADWCFDQGYHTLVVHVEGRLRRMESVFTAGPSSTVLPSVGDLWVIPAGRRYAALAQGGMARFVEIRLPTALIGDAALAPRVADRDPFLYGVAARLADLVPAEDDISRMLMHAIGEALRLHLSHTYGPARASSGPRAAVLSDGKRERIASAVRDQLDEAQSLASLAAAVDLPVRQFLAAFRTSFGTSPWQYVLAIRLAEGARLLRETNDPVTDIALGVGFSTPSHFTTMFRRRFGVHPSAYRQQTSR